MFSATVLPLFIRYGSLAKSTAVAGRWHMARRTDQAPDTRVQRQAKKIRNDHGTRVSVRIVCSVCGQSDTIPFAPKDPSRAMCRKCAFEILDVSDPDVRDLSVHHFSCAQCGRDVELRVGIEVPEEVFCRDCVQGIESKQEDRALRGTKSAGGRVVRARRTEER